MHTKLRFKLKVVPSQTTEISGEDEGTLRLLALEDGTVVIGMSLTHTDLWERFSIAFGRAYMPNVYAQGKSKDGVLIFEQDTPLWKQDAVLHFLAGEAMQMAIANEKASQMRVRQKFGAASTMNTAAAGIKCLL